MNFKDKTLCFLNKVKSPLIAGCAVVGAAVPTFAGEVTTFSVTSAMVDPIVNSINSGLTTLVPIGVGVMATMIGIHLIPRIIYKFI